MTQKHFYTKIADTQTLKVSVASLDISDEERDHLERLIDASLHTTILDLILSELGNEEKQIFLDHLITGDDDKIWQHLAKNITDVEQKIKKAADDLTNELQEDMRSI